MSELAPLIDALPGARVLCVGDVMLDRFVTGAVDRISPEAPIPVLRITGESLLLGGVGNVAANLATLGVQVGLFSVIGDDAAGQGLAARAREMLGNAGGLLVDAGRPTTVKTRFFAHQQQLLRVDEESVAPLSAAAEKRLFEAISAALPGAGALILSDYGKGVLTPTLIKSLIHAAQAAGVKVVVDPKGTDYDRYAGATVLTPNRKELAQATGMPVSDPTLVERAARTLINAHEVESVVATLSEQGMLVVWGRTDKKHLEAEAREVFDVSGAGDTVVAVLAACLAVGASLVDAAALANAAAGIVVGKVGTAVVRPDELRGVLQRSQWEGPAGKVGGLDTVVDRVQAWRRQGLKVGFTNGCFDLLHPGHVSLLGQAKAACDRLVVGLNSDASVKRLKGESRPAQPEGARAIVLASLAAVDAVVLFEDDTPLRLIEAIRPDVLVKGADYTVATVVGSELVQSYGGRIVLADLLDGHSTTGTLKRLGR